MAETIGDMVVSIVGDSTQFTHSIDLAQKSFMLMSQTVANSAKDIAESFRRIDGEASVWGNSVDLIKQKQEVLKQEITNLIAQGVDPLSTRIEKLQKEYYKLGNEAIELEKKQKSLKDRMTELADSAIRLGGSLSTYVTLPLIGLATAAVKSSAEMEMLETSFSTMLGSAEKAADLMASLKEMAAKTPFETTDLANVTKSLLQYGVTADSILPTLQMLGDVSGGNSAKFAGLSYQYAQMVAAGRLLGTDLRSMVTNGFNPLQEIARTTGETMASLQEKMSKGAITTDMVAAAFKSATSAGGKFYNGMNAASQTLEGLISTLKDDLGALGRSFVDEFIPILKDIVRQLSSLTQSFTALDSGTKKTILTIGALLAALGPGLVVFGTMTKLVIALGIGLTGTAVGAHASTAAIVINKMALIAHTVATQVWAIAQAAMTLATVGGTVAMKGFTIALLNNPIGAVAVVLGLLVVGLIAYKVAQDNATKSTYDAYTQEEKLARLREIQIERQKEERTLQVAIDMGRQKTIAKIKEHITALEAERKGLISDLAASEAFYKGTAKAISEDLIPAYRKMYSVMQLYADLQRKRLELEGAEKAHNEARVKQINDEIAAIWVLIKAQESSSDKTITQDEQIAQAKKNIAAGLLLIDQQEKIAIATGVEYNALEEKRRLIQEYLNKLIASGFTIENAGIKDIIAQYNALITIQGKVGKAIKFVESTIIDSSEVELKSKKDLIDTTTVEAGMYDIIRYKGEIYHTVIKKIISEEARWVDHLRQRMKLESQLAVSSGEVFNVEQSNFEKEQDYFDRRTKNYKEKLAQNNIQAKSDDEYWINFRNNVEEGLSIASSVYSELTSAVGSYFDYQQSVYSKLEETESAYQETISKNLDSAIKAQDEKLQAELEAAGVAEQTEIEKLQAELDAAKKAGDEETIKEAEDALEREKIIEKYEAEKTRLTDEANEAIKVSDAKLAAEKKRLNYEEAVSNKAIALFDIVINTAVAVVKSLPNLWLAGFATLTGLAQAALVANQPLPALAQGGIVLPKPNGVNVTVAEAGLPEVIIPLDKLNQYIKPATSIENNYYSNKNNSIVNNQNSIRNNSITNGQESIESGMIELTVKIDSDSILKKIFPATKNKKILISAGAIV
jgi:tape measure domain-containing protein